MFGSRCLYVFISVDIGPEDQRVNVGVEEATKKGAKGTPGLDPFEVGGVLLSVEGLGCQTEKP